jgi:hypothetical protein
MTPTLITKSIDWFNETLDSAVKNNPFCSFSINSFVRVYTQQDIFNQEFFKDQRILYPFVSYQLKTVEVDVSRMGSIVTRKKGQPLFNLYRDTGSNEVEKEWVTNITKDRIKEFSLVPVIIELELNFVSNTANHVEEFFLAWVDLYPQVGGFLAIEEQEMTIRAIASTRMDFPEKDHAETGPVYKLPLACTIWSHVGRVFDVAAITSNNNITPSEGPVTDKAGNVISPVIKTSINLPGKN